MYLDIGGLMIITEETRPKCKKCGKPALTYMNGVFYCGQCVSDFIDRMSKASEKLMMEEK